MNKKKPRGGADEDNGFAGWGGYMAAKKAKLEEQFSMKIGREVGQKTEIFKGISIFVNGYTDPTASELKQIMLMHGGIYHHYESNSTTHIIASNLPDCKVKQLKTLNVVKPAWIVDSIAAGCLLDYKKYLLYSRQTKSQPRLNFPQHQLSSAALSIAQEPMKSIIDGEELTEGDHQNAQHENENVQHKDDVCDKQMDDFINKELPKTSLSTKNSPLSRKNSPLKDKSSVISKRTAVEPQFLSEFYGNSRLHHLSTMGAMFKEYVSKLRERSQGDFPGVKRLTEWKKRNSSIREVRDDDFGDELVDEMFESANNSKGIKGPKIIMHIDMDCFFVSVGLRNMPELEGYPVAVTHAKGNKGHTREGVNRQYERDFYRKRFENRLKERESSAGGGEEVAKTLWLDEAGEKDSLSEIASCNYEARKAGLKNGMFFGTAIKLCPNLKTIPYDFEGYKEVSFKLYDILASYTLNIEAVSCDEMYVNCTEVLNKAGVTALEFASFLREEIKSATGCTASTGFGSNPLQARLATKKAKPNGQFLLQPSDVELFMHGIKVEDLPGVGYSLAYQLRAEGIVTCRDLQRISLVVLQKKFGTKTGEALYCHARGEDNRELDMCHKRKSVSAEVNYGIRFTTQKEAETFLCQLSEEVAMRMKQASVRGQKITLKVMVRAKDAPVETAKFMGHGACDSVSRTSSLGAPSDDAGIIYREVVCLERQLKILPSDLRGVGIQISRLENTTASKTPKNNVLTNFLKMGKASVCASKDSKERVGVQEQNTANEKRQDNEKEDTHSTSSSVNKERVVNAQKVTVKEKSAEDNKGNISLGREVNINENVSKESFPNQNKIINVKSSGDASGSATKEDDSLPLLTPPVEVPMMTLVQARKLVRSWVMAEVCPQKCDVVMFASYLQQLVVAHRLEDLEVLYNLLHRLLVNKGKMWKIAYQNIVKDTQVIMQAIYGADLKVPEFYE